MSGASWFDLTLPRFGGAHPLVSHWSRLIDVPLAGLLSGFEIFLPADKAELVVRALWPLLVFWAFVYLLAREAQIHGGRTAALLSIPLTVTCIIGIVQFLPGRIDHHNAMILGAVIGILRLARSFDDPRAGWSAGVLLGLGTAVGYEALALTAASLGSRCSLRPPAASQSARPLARRRRLRRHPRRGARDHHRTRAHVHEPLRRAVHEPRAARGLRRRRRLGCGGDGGSTLTVGQAGAARARPAGSGFPSTPPLNPHASPGRSARSTPRCSPSGSAASRRRKASSRWGRSYPRSAGWRLPISRPASTAA